MIQLLFVVLVAEPSVAVALQKFVVLGLDCLKTVAGVVLVLLASTLYSVAEITSPQADYYLPTGGQVGQILLPICFLGHFMLFAFDMVARSVLVLDPLLILDWFKGNESIVHYLVKTLKIFNKLNLVLEVANAPWIDGICDWRRIVPIFVPKTKDWSASGFFVINFMRAWNDQQLQPPICTDVFELRKKFLVDLLKYNGNESKDKIPEVVREFAKRMR